MRLIKRSIFSDFLRSYSSEISRIQRLVDIIVSFYIFTINSGLNKSPFLYYLATYSITIFCLKPLYKSLRSYSSLSIITRVASVYLAISLFTFFLNSLFIFDFRNDIFLYLFKDNVSFFLYLFLSHFCTRFLLKKYRKKGGNTRNILVWGEYKNVRKIFDEIEQSKWQGFNIRVWFSPEIETKNLSKVKCEGGFKEMKNWLDKNNTDLVIIASDNKNIKKAIEFFGNTNLKVYFFPLWADNNMKLSLTNIGSRKLISIWETNNLPLSLFIKRILDITISFILIILLFPLFLVIYILLKYITKNNCFYLQERNGFNGKSFLIYKFRTMKNCDSGNEKDLKQVIKDDERVTPLGKYLRKYSLDELPQLYNVLVGEMSLVGPRPHAVSHNELYRNKISGYMQRHSIKPGMTGLAQIKGLRGETKNIKDMKDRVKADLEYIQNWNLILDMKILIKTIFIIFKGSAF